jgi:sec-independent protein translocase protein TatB
MLPSLGFNEILILGVLALLVVGPKDLPLLFRKLGRWTAKLRGMAQEFRTGFDELARQAELDELKREVDALRRTTSLQEIRSELTKPLPTLEDYAGVKSPAIAAPSADTPAVDAPASSSMEEAPRNGAGGDRVEAGESPQEAISQSSRASPPQSALRADSSSIEEEQAPAAPIARSGP